MRRIATVILIFGVVFGFGSGIASVARHARWACHGGGNGYGPPGPWGRWDRPRDVEEKATPAPQPQTVVVQPQQPAAPAPVIVQQPQPAAAPAPIIIVVPSPYGAAPAPQPAQPAVAPSPSSP